MKLIEFYGKFIAIDKIQSIYRVESSRVKENGDEITIYEIFLECIMTIYRCKWDDRVMRDIAFNDLLSQLKHGTL